MCSMTTGRGKGLRFVENPQAITSWGFAEDVSIHGTDQTGELVVIGLPWRQARQLALDLFRASLQAEELDKGYFEAMAESASTGDGLETL